MNTISQVNFFIHGERRLKKHTGINNIPQSGKKMNKKTLYRIYNLKTDASYFGISSSKGNVCAQERFSLDLGMHPCRTLQDDYTKTGLELFVIETIKESDETEELVTMKAELEKQLEDKGITVYR